MDYRSPCHLKMAADSRVVFSNIEMFEWGNGPELMLLCYNVVCVCFCIEKPKSLSKSDRYKIDRKIDKTVFSRMRFCL